MFCESLSFLLKELKACISHNSIVFFDFTIYKDLINNPRRRGPDFTRIEQVLIEQEMKPNIIISQKGTDETGDRIVYTCWKSLF